MLYMHMCVRVSTCLYFMRVHESFVARLHVHMPACLHIRDNALVGLCACTRVLVCAHACTRCQRSVHPPANLVGYFTRQEKSLLTRYQQRNLGGLACSVFVVLFLLFG